MHSKIDAITAPATVVAGSGMFSLNYIMENGLHAFVQFGNALLIVAGVLLAFSKWRISQLEYARLKREMDKEDGG